MPDQRPEFDKDSQKGMKRAVQFNDKRFREKKTVQSHRGLAARFGYGGIRVRVGRPLMGERQIEQSTPDQGGGGKRGRDEGEMFS